MTACWFAPGTGFSAPVDSSTRTVTLEDAFAASLETSSEIALARERIDAAAVNIARAWALVLPTWNLSLNYTHRAPEPPELTFPAFPNFGSDAVKAACRDPNNPSATTPTEACILAVLEEFGRAIDAPATTLDFARADTISLSSQISWTFLNGRFFAARANAADAVELERDRLETARSAVLLAVARAYFGVLAAERAVTVAERAEARARNKFAMDADRAAAGQESRLRTKASEIHVEESAIDTGRAKNALARARVAFRLAALIDGPFEVEAPALASRLSIDADAMIERAKQRPDVRAALRTIAMAEREVDDFWWKFAPTLSLFGAFRGSNVAGITGQNTEWTVGANANLVLFDAGLRYADRDEAQSHLVSARLARERLLRNIRSEIENARLQIVSAELAQRRAAVMVQLAATTLEGAERQRDAGTIREIDLREALDALADAEFAGVKADLERDLAEIELQSVLGELKP